MKYLFLFIVLFLSNAFYTQITELNSWVGHYEGILYMEFPDGRKDSLTIHLDLHAKENPALFVYKVSFFSEKYGNQVKDYRLGLNTDFEDNKHYILDEQDGILIDEVLLNHTLFSNYSVAGSNFQTVLRKESDHLYYEIVCSSPDKGRTTTSESTDEEGEAFEVESALVYTVQYAKLFKN